MSSGVATFVSDFENAINRSDVSIQELEVLSREFPKTPLIWQVYSRRLSHNVACKLVHEKAKALRSIELWLEYANLKRGESAAARFSMLAQAVEDVGFDPRSTYLWLVFFQLFTEIRTHFRLNKEKYLAQCSGTEMTSVVESKAPLISLESQDKPYRERHLINEVAEDDLFTVAITWKEICLDMMAEVVNPLAGLCTTTNECPVHDGDIPDLCIAIRKGELSIENFKAYLKMLALNPVKDVKNARTALAELDGELAGQLDALPSVYNSALANIERMYPLQLFTQPSSALMPEIDESSVEPWCRILELEISDHLYLRQLWPGMYRDRLNFFLFIAMRQCGNVPHVYFINAQMLFSKGLLSEGLQHLYEMVEHPSLASKASLSIVLADAEELFRGDAVLAESILAKTIRAHVTNENSCTAHLDNVIFHLFVRKLRIHGEDHFFASLQAMLTDHAILKHVTPELCLGLIYLMSGLVVYKNLESNEILIGHSTNEKIKGAIAQIMNNFPDNADIAYLFYSNKLPMQIDYISILTAVESLPDRSSSFIKDLYIRSARQAYYSQMSYQQVQKFFRGVNASTQLCSPEGNTSFTDYMQWVLSFPSPLPSRLSISSEVKPLQMKLTNLVTVAGNLASLRDIARLLLPKGSLEMNTNSLVNELYAATKHTLNTEQRDLLEKLASDTMFSQVVDRWFRASSSS